MVAVDGWGAVWYGWEMMKIDVLHEGCAECGEDECAHEFWDYCGRVTEMGSAAYKMQAKRMNRWFERKDRVVNRPDNAYDLARRRRRQDVGRFIMEEFQRIKNEADFPAILDVDMNDLDYLGMLVLKVEKIRGSCRELERMDERIRIWRLEEAPKVLKPLEGLKKAATVTSVSDGEPAGNPN